MSTKQHTKTSLITITAFTALSFTLASVILWAHPRYMKMAGVIAACCGIIALIVQLRKEREHRQWFTHIAGTLLGLVLWLATVIIGIPILLTLAPSTEKERSALLARIEGFAQRKTFYAVIKHTRKDGTAVDTQLTIRGRDPRIYRTFAQLASDPILNTMMRATITSEDQDIFTRMLPISFTGIVRSFAHYVRTRQMRGGSTIPQQIARWVIRRQRGGNAERKAMNKIRELFAAYHIVRLAHDAAKKRRLAGERITRQEQLVEWYMNLIPARGTGRGAIDACNGNFGHVCRTTLEAIYTGVNNPKSPNNYCPYRGKSFRKRGCARAIIVARRMIKAGFLENAAFTNNILPCTQNDALAYAKRPREQHEERDSHLARVIRERLRQTDVAHNGSKRTLAWYGNSGIVVQTTIDPAVQTILAKAVRTVADNAHSILYKDRTPTNDEEVTVAAVIAKNGRIVALDSSKEKYNFFTADRFSPGSVAKVALFAKWILFNPKASAETPLDNRAMTVQWKFGERADTDWTPRHDHPPLDVCEAKWCFAHSENLAAVSLLQSLMNGATKDEYTQALERAIGYWLWWHTRGMHHEHNADENGNGSKGTRSAQGRWIARTLDIDFPNNWETLSFTEQNAVMQRYAKTIIADALELKSFWRILTAIRGANALQEEGIERRMIQQQLIEIYKNDPEKRMTARIYAPTLKDELEKKIERTNELFKRHANDLDALPKNVQRSQLNERLTIETLNALMGAFKRKLTLTREERFALEYHRRNYEPWSKHMVHIEEIAKRHDELHGVLRRINIDLQAVNLKNLMHDDRWNLHVNTWLVGYELALATGKPFEPTPAKVTLGAEEFTLFELARAMTTFMTGRHMTSAVEILGNVTTLQDSARTLYTAGPLTHEKFFTVEQRTRIHELLRATIHQGGTAHELAKTVPVHVGGKTGTAQMYHAATFAAFIGEGTVMIATIYLRTIAHEWRRRKIQGTFAAKCVLEFFKNGGANLIDAPATPKASEPEKREEQRTTGSNKEKRSEHNEPDHSNETDDR